MPKDVSCFDIIGAILGFDEEDVFINEKQYCALLAEVEAAAERTRIRQLRESIWLNPNFNLATWTPNRIERIN